jgi:hypothetical protein
MIRDIDTELDGPTIPGSSFDIIFTLLAQEGENELIKLATHWVASFI